MEIQIPISVPNNHVMSELRCHGYLLTAPQCLRQVLAFRISVIEVSDG